MKFVDYIFGHETNCFHYQVWKFYDQVSIFHDQVSKSLDQVWKFYDQVWKFHDQASKFHDQVWKFHDQVSKFMTDFENFMTYWENFNTRFFHSLQENILELWDWLCSKLKVDQTLSINILILNMTHQFTRSQTTAVLCVLKDTHQLKIRIFKG